MRAVVFANHNVGVRCLLALLAGGMDVPLVVTHPRAADEDDAFASVEMIAREAGLLVVMPDDVNDTSLVDRIRGLAPDLLFSFYYRQLLEPELLGVAPRGALNMHGSLLPKYRGRAPVNWAVIRGETETGATLHYMTERADAGDIVDQQAVPILPNDTAFDVYTKVTVAAELVLSRTLPSLLTGSAPRRAQDVNMATYFGRRRPEDGRIDWTADAKTIHNLVRGVAPPYPGAYTFVQGRKLRILKTRYEATRSPRALRPSLYWADGACFIDCAGGGVLRVLAADIVERVIPPEKLDAPLSVPDGIELLVQDPQRIKT